MKPQFVWVLFLALALLLSSCTKQLITPEELEKLKTDKASLESKNTELQKQVDNLKSQAEEAESKAQLWGQLMNGYNAEPYTPSMPDHKWIALGDGSYLFLHFNKDPENADELMYTGLALPGKFCKEDQEQLPQAFGHFHPSQCAETDAEKCHGGKGGEDGYWLMHVALKDMDMPWGAVKAGGVDTQFMPTPAPSCAPPEEEAAQ